MKIYDEEQMLDAAVRKDVVKSIQESSNQKRKNEAKRRHEVYKDKTMKYVMKKLENEGLKEATLKLVQNRASNISVAKKIVNKKARAYKAGCIRTAGNEHLNNQIDLMATLLQFNSGFKKVDRYLHLQRNALPWFVPEYVGTTNDGAREFILKMKVFSPWQYDAIENPRDIDCPIGIILSDYYDAKQSSVIPGGANQVQGMDATDVKDYDRGGAPIAEGSALTEAMPAETYIFWGNKYHFTMDKNGGIIRALSPEDLLNPIQMLPGVPLAKERDEGFWADGGDDLIDGAILINTQITDLNAIMFMQGWGQFVITGPKGSIPKQMETGPHHAMVLTYQPKKGEQKPEVTVVSGNPPIDGWMRAIEQYCALLLSTNNMSPSSIAGKLDAASFPSGIAMLFEHSESTEDVSDSQKDFVIAERRAWKVISAWQNYLHERKALAPDFMAVGRLPEPNAMEVIPKFHDAREFMPDSERLDNMKKKKDLGIVRQVELIMEENPGMSEEEAMVKLMQIKKERMEEAGRMAKELNGDQGDQQDDGNDAE